MRFGPLVALVILAGIGAADGIGKDQPAPTSRGRRRSRSAQLGDGPVPVTVEIVKKETVPVYRQGIGMCTLSTVTVRSQIDGRLISVDFVEGQNVRKGGCAGAHRPRCLPRRNTIRRSQKKRRNEATLANARIDLQRYKTLAQENAGPKNQADQAARGCPARRTGKGG